jgi:hypothetical protein
MFYRGMDERKCTLVEIPPTIVALEQSNPVKVVVKRVIKTESSGYYFTTTHGIFRFLHSIEL